MPADVHRMCLVRCSCWVHAQLTRSGPLRLSLPDVPPPLHLRVRADQPGTSQSQRPATAAAASVNVPVRFRKHLVVSIATSGNVTAHQRPRAPVVVAVDMLLRALRSATTMVSGPGTARWLGCRSAFRVPAFVAAAASAPVAVAGQYTAELQWTTHL